MLIKRKRKKRHGESECNRRGRLTNCEAREDWQKEVSFEADQVLLAAEIAILSAHATGAPFARINLHNLCVAARHQATLIARTNHKQLIFSV